MKLRLFPLLAVLCAVGGLFAQQPRNLKVLQTDNYVIQTLTERINLVTGSLTFRKGLAMEPGEFLNAYKTHLGLSADDELVLNRVQQGLSGEIIYRYGQVHRGLPVEGVQYVVFTRDGELIKLKGRAAENLDLPTTLLIDEDAALETAINSVDAYLFEWERPELRAKVGMPSVEMLPRGQKVILKDPNSTSWDPVYRTAYKFRIDSIEPIASRHVYVDGETGELLHSVDLMQYADGFINTGLYGQRSMITTEQLNGAFILRDDTRNIHARRYDDTEPNWPDIEEYEDANNIWPGQSGPMSLWTVQMAYDYFVQRHSHTGPDNTGEAVRIRADWDNGSAYRDDVVVSELFFQSGWATLDVAGHEYTHAVIARTSSLNAQGESGALAESFADIFGIMSEARVLGGANNDWKFGDDTPGGAFRSLVDPNEFNHPDTYQGTFWITQTGCIPTAANDFCGIHTNNGVPNHWFYLLSQGGAQNGVNVAGIGNIRARNIAFRAMTIELFPNADFFDAREATLDATDTLYGCGQETFNVANAWSAVGVGATGGGLCAPPPPTPLSAQIVGPDSAVSNGPTFWTSQVSGGQAPYTYQWKVNGAMVGSNATYSVINPTTAFVLQLTVTDSAGQSILDTKFIQICDTPDQCIGPVEPRRSER